MSNRPVVGVLALQGCVAPHLAMYDRLGVEARPVRLKEELDTIDRLIMPGGESTTMLRLIESSGIWEALLDFGMHRPVWGVCAGAILIAKQVQHPAQRSLGLISITATRNYYGCQLDSFKASVNVSGFDSPLAVDFIRAPRLDPIGSNIEVLAYHDSQPTLLRQGHILASAFHTELGTDPRLHHFFLKIQSQ